MPPRSHVSVPGPSERSLLLNIARRAPVFLTPDGHAHARIPLSGNTVPLSNPIFRDWLSLAFEERGFFPSDTQWAAVLRQLEEDAHNAVEPFEVHLRTAYTGTNTYTFDLYNNDNDAIEVNGKQWTVTYNDMCRFRRTAASLPLPTPEPNAAPIEKFLMRMFDITEPKAQMLVTWLVSALLPGLHPPVLVITGEEAEEAATKLRNIIDPVKCAVLPLPLTEHQYGQTAAINRVVAFSVGSQITEKCKQNLNKIRKGIKVKLYQVSKRREALFTTIHRPLIIAAQGLVKIHDSQLHIEINKTCNTLHEQILASLMDAVVRGIREMSRQPKHQYFSAPDLLPPPPLEPSAPPPVT